LRLKRTPSLKAVLRDPEWLEEIWQDAISAATAETGLDNSGPDGAFAPSGRFFRTRSQAGGLAFD